MAGGWTIKGNNNKKKYRQALQLPVSVPICTCIWSYHSNGQMWIMVSIRMYMNS